MTIIDTDLFPAGDKLLTTNLASSVDPLTEGVNPYDAQGSNQPEMSAYRSRRQPRPEKSARGQGAA